MFDGFVFQKLTTKHKWLFRLYQVGLFGTIAGLTYGGIVWSNTELATASDQMSVTIGGMTAMLVGLFAYMGKLKGLVKIKFLMFGLVWFLLFSLQMVMPVLLWTIGLVIAPLAIDDLILLPIWKNVWYNNYEQ